MIKEKKKPMTASEMAIKRNNNKTPEERKAQASEAVKERWKKYRESKGLIKSGE